MGILTGGALTSYLLDFLCFRDATFVAVWVSVFAAVVSLFIASSHLFVVTMFNVALVYNMLITCACIGLWATLQFTFLQRQHPRLVLVFERLLFAVAPASPTVVTTWAVVAYNGMHAAPFVLLAFMTVAFYLYVLPVRSSFRVVGKGRSKAPSSVLEELDEIVMGRFETAVHTVAYVMLPCFFKVAVHHQHLIASKDDVADLVLLVAVPLLVVTSLSSKGSLWWLGLSSSTVGWVKKSLIIALVLVVVGCVEVRVIFHSLAHYIKLQPPWNYAAVTASVYLFTFIALAHFGGMLESKTAAVFLTLMAVGGAVAGCIALGMPWYMLPFAAGGAFFWVRFYYYRRLVDYLAFVGTAAAAMTWFVIRSFFFLDFEFDPLPMSLRHVCMVLIGVVILSLLIPGLVAANRSSADVNGWVMVAHAAGMTLLELQLHCQFKGIYPSYLVVFSSALGAWLAQYLFNEDKLTLTTAWALGAIYCGKLGLTLHPSLATLVASLCAALAISPVYVGVLYLQPRGERQALKAPPGAQGLSLKAQLPFALAASHLAAFSLVASALTLALTRHSLLGVVIRSTFYPRASEAFIIGSAMAAWPLANLGLATHHLPSSDALRRLLAVSLSLGLVLMIVEPDTSFLFGHRAGAERGAGQGPTWASWALIGCACSLLLLCSAAVRRNGLLRTLAAGGAGALMGLYFDASFMPKSTLLLASTATAAGLASIFIAGLVASGARPGGSGARGGGGVGVGMQVVFVLFVAILPMTYMLQPSMLREIPANYRAEALELRRAGLLGMHAALSLMIALVIKLKVARAEAEAAAAAAGGRRGSAALRGRPVAGARGAVAGELAEWVPSSGNVAAVGSLALALQLCMGHLNAGPPVVFVLAPILLLLNQDTGLFAVSVVRSGGGVLVLPSLRARVAPAPIFVNHEPAYLTPTPE
jgi:hypothetical protein